VLIDSAGAGEQASLVPATNTRAVFRYLGNWYKLLNRQGTFATVMCKSTDEGASWSVLDSANSPLFETCSGFFDGLHTVYCVFVNVNGGDGELRLIDFDLLAETWGAAYGATNAPTAAQNASITIWKQTDTLLLAIYRSRNAFPGDGSSGLGAAVYDLFGGLWMNSFDLGVNITLLPGWDAAQTVALNQFSTSVMDDDGTVHVFFTTASVQTVPVVWGNRCFYQSVDNGGNLVTFFDFPGQVAPFPAFPYNTQQLNAFSGSPMGVPIILADQDIIVLPVLMRNDSVIDRFPVQLANVYLGSPVSAPVWALNTSLTIDPGALVDDFIWPQEAPAASFDGTKIYCVFPAQDEDGQNFARMRLCQTANLANPAIGWTAQTIFDLQVDAPPGFNFPTQELVGLSISAPAAGAGAAAPFRLALYGYKRFKNRECAPDLAELPYVAPPRRVL
jgi:hypothetical protein